MGLSRFHTRVLRLERLQPAVLDPIILDVHAGECLIVRGPSGSGKTLLLRAIADLDPCPGDAILDDIPRSTISGPAWRRRVAYVPAESGWWADQVGDHFEDWQRVVQDHGSLGLPTDCDRWGVQRLSTGERQRLALLRAIEQAPRVLLLDEPTSALDATATAAVESLLDRRRCEGATLFWVTHDPQQAARVGNRQLTLSERHAVLT